MRSWALNDEELMLSAIANESTASVVYCNGDGCVPVREHEGGTPLTIKKYRDFVSECGKADRVPILCVDSGRDAWVRSSTDITDFMRIKHKVLNGQLELYDE